MQTMSGPASASQLLTVSSRALTELTFQVAIFMNSPQCHGPRKRAIQAMKAIALRHFHNLLCNLSGQRQFHLDGPLLRAMTIAGEAKNAAYTEKLVPQPQEEVAL